MKSKIKKPEEKFPLLRCPECGYEYRPTSSGWAFRTDKNTKCIGLPIEGENLSLVSRMPAFHHPFVCVEE
ncbi:hypothetical protein EVB55_189 [Rhizobium phage RHph_Y68]|uniref:Uncharacterized protein n=1 Tax=Rhizobium phage RHph_Y68 TaxID=2509787 RepID=A0A7S5UT04_9CAUD|nr:hypothetical protein PP934_gp189 [Rhizobium phage RHph_Y68]QIG68124.1 hypothetical protein EVB55_189 [Rhizobium phage RHph_Y68]